MKSRSPGTGTEIRNPKSEKATAEQKRLNQRRHGKKQENTENSNSRSKSWIPDSTLMTRMMRIFTEKSEMQMQIFEPQIKADLSG